MMNHYCDKLRVIRRRLRRIAGKACLAVAVAAPSVAAAEIIWDGNFDQQDFRNYHTSSDPKSVKFHLVPAYGRPPQYGFQDPGHVGNGDLLSLVESPTRGGKYAAKFTIKSNGAEPADCDPATSCERRRSFLQMTSTFLDYYDAIPQGAERWLSFSIYLPSDLDVSGDGFGPIIWGSKSSLENKPGAFGLELDTNGWNLIHRYYSEEMHKRGVDPAEAWWLAAEYSESFPSATDWPQGLVDFPDVAASRAALRNVNVGGWTDFIWHFKTDLDGFEQNNGFLDVYMRAGSGAWVHVLKVRPMKDLARNADWTDSEPERVYDRGIGQYGPDGYTSQIGLYMSKTRVNGHDLTIFVDNHKVGDEDATFADMSPDGSSPAGVATEGGEEPPRPPVLH